MPNRAHRCALPSKDWASTRNGDEDKEVALPVAVLTLAQLKRPDEPFDLLATRFGVWTLKGSSVAEDGGGTARYMCA
jgi:hypothetical protein